MTWESLCQFACVFVCPAYMLIDPELFANDTLIEVLLGAIYCNLAHGYYCESQVGVLAKV